MTTTTTSRRLFWLCLCFWSLTVVATENNANDLFDRLDANHDGHLDKPEFTTGYEQLKGSGSNWFFSSFFSTTKETPSTPDMSDKKKSLHEKFWKSFTKAVAMIVATEIGDKTFFIAAVMSMKHDRSAVFAGAISALVIMTILSTAMGVVLPNVLPRRYTHLLGALLFLYFGVKLLLEGKGMQAGKASDELEEVEEELLLQSTKKEDDADEEQGSTNKTTTTTTPTTSSKKRRPQQSWLKIALQSLSLTFIAEWGDRSQIATIALAASHHPVGVTIGGCLGHSFCTGLAVLGGRMLAARISEKTVHLAGGGLFLLFGLHSLFLEE